MKTLLVFTLVLVTLLVICESRKHHDDKFLLKKKHDKFALLSKHHHGRSRLRGSHLKLREGGVHEGIKGTKGTECVKTKCGHREVCIANPKTGDEKCVDKKRLRESRKLFHDFKHEKESVKKHVDSDLVKKELDTAEHMEQVYDLLKDYNKYHKHGDKKIDIKDVMNLKTVKGKSNECKPKDMYELKRRLVGWSVLQHTESRIEHHRRKFRKLGHFKKHDSKEPFGKKPDLRLKSMDTNKHHVGKRSVQDTVQTETHHHCKCSKSVMWEFRKKDTNHDGELSHDELSVIESNRMEPCLHPLFKSCDTDSNGILTHGEWCCCMADTIPPCFEKKRNSDKKFYLPTCDKEGYYKREQCLVDKSYCWCVDINGNEIMHTKKAGHAKCGIYDPNGHLLKM